MVGTAPSLETGRFSYWRRGEQDSRAFFKSLTLKSRPWAVQYSWKERRKASASIVITSALRTPTSPTPTLCTGLGRYLSVIGSLVYCCLAAKAPRREKEPSRLLLRGLCRFATEDETLGRHGGTQVAQTQRQRRQVSIELESNGRICTRALPHRGERRTLSASAASLGACPRHRGQEEKGRAALCLRSNSGRQQESWWIISHFEAEYRYCCQ